jgi:hypothetical protein
MGFRHERRVEMTEQEKAVFCTECGAKNQSGAKFCYQCGTAITAGLAASVEGVSVPRGEGTSTEAKGTVRTIDPSVKVEILSPGLQMMTIRFNGVDIPVRKFVQSERLIGKKKETIASKLVRELRISQTEAEILVDDAWDSVPQARLAAEGVKNGLGMLFGIFCVVGFFVVIGAILFGTLRSGISALGGGQVVGAGAFFLVAYLVFAYARWAVKAK